MRQIYICGVPHLRCRGRTGLEYPSTIFEYGGSRFLFYLPAPMWDPRNLSVETIFESGVGAVVVGAKLGFEFGGRG